MTDELNKIVPLTSAPTVAVARLDWTSARFVEEGIKLQPVYGTRYAADFLKNRMIDINVTLRVLVNPSQRRMYVNS